METISLLEIASKLSLKQKHSHFLKELGLGGAVGREVVIFFRAFSVTSFTLTSFSEFV